MGTVEIDRPFPRPDILTKVRGLGRTSGLDASSFLDRYADAYGERPMLFSDRVLAFPRSGGGVSYRQAADVAARLGSVFRDHGLAPGDALAFLTANRAELALGVLAALRAGLVAVPLNPTLRASEVASSLKRAGATALVADGETVHVAEEVAPERLFVVDPAGPRSAVWLPQAIDQAAPAPPAAVRPEDPALIVFTSGTTGEPKGATITHRALATVLRRYARIARLLPAPSKQLILLVMPLAHTGGFITLLTTASLGAPSLVVSRFDARAILELIEDAQPSVFAGTPAMYKLLLDAGAAGYDLSSIRVWGGGADVFHRDLLDRLRRLGGWRRWGVDLKPFTIIGYGASETAGAVTISPPVPIGERCIGWVLPGFEHRVVDEDGREVGRDEPGELVLRGGSLMSGYWEDRARTEDAMTGGWFRTGDIVRKGRLGLLYYEGRHKDVIKTGGYSVAAREIEEVLEAHAGVDRAAAVGIPDEIKGEKPVAVVVLREGHGHVTPRELHEWADERLAPYKRPRQIYLAERIPLTPSFKPRKAEIRDMLAGAEALDDT